MTQEFDDFILYLHVDFVFGVANKYCVKMYFERSWFCILLRNVFLIFVCVLLFGFFFVVDNLCAFYNCLQIEDLNLKFEKKRKTTQKKNLQNFMTILMNKFHSSKEKNTFFEKIKSESIYHQDKRNPNCLWLFWRQLVMNQSKTRFHRARRSPFVFGINKVAARKSTRKITGKNLNAKLIKKETNLNLKHCLVKVQSLNLTFIYLQG